VTPQTTARTVTLGLWLATVVSLLAWMAAGYSRILCVTAVLPLLAPLNGLIRGRRYTYGWATLFAIPYLALALTELLVNPSARWIVGTSLLLVFAWFCTMIWYLRVSRERPG